MKPNVWKNKYGISSNNDVEYFGEVDVVNKTVNPKGTGLLFYPDDKIFKMVENIDNNQFDGMFIANFRVEDNSVITYHLGFYKDDCVEDAVLRFGLNNTNNNIKHDIVFMNFNSEGKQDGPIVFVTPNNEFYIQECKDGVLLNKVIRFKYGKLILEDLANNSIVDVIDCGYKFEAKYCEPKYELCYSFKNYGYKPAICKTEVVRNQYQYNYLGAVLTYSMDQRYHVEKRDKIFTNEVANFGIVENLNGDKYFGNIKSSNSKGGFSREGLGCYRRKNGDCYLGSYETSYRMGYGIIKENGVVSFGKFFFDEKDGVFFEKKENSLRIYVYEKNKKVGDFYEINNDTFNVLKKNKDGEPIKFYSFDNKNGVKELIVSNEDKISDEIKKDLELIKLTYEVNDEGEIYVTGSSKSDKLKSYNIQVPSYVTGIRKYAFIGRKNLEFVVIDDGVKIVEEGAFKDCPNIKSLYISNTVEVIEPYTFDSKKLIQLNIPLSMKLIKDFSFIECKNLEVINLNGNIKVVIEDYAFPERFKNYNGMNTDEELRKKKREQEQREKKNKEREEKIKKQLERKKERQESLNRTLGAISSFFKKISKVFYNFFDDLFYNIKDFFKYDVKYFFTRLKIGKINTGYKKSKSKSYRYKEPFFKKVFNGLFGWVKDLFSSSGAIGTLLILLSIGFFILAYTGLITKVSWDVRPLWPKDNAFFGYNFELACVAINLMDITYNSEIMILIRLVLIILVAVLFLIFAILDMVLYVLMLLVLCILAIAVQIIIQLGVVFVVPALFLVGILALRLDKKTKIFMILITLVFVVLYYVFMIRFI